MHDAWDGDGDGGTGSGSARARDELRRLILDGHLPAGAVLSQVALASRFGLSRTPLREALRMLQEEGLVDAPPNRRARVRPFDAADLDAAYAARILVEALAFATATARAGADAPLRASLERLHTAADGRAGADWLVEHQRFHALLLTGCAPGVERAAQGVTARSAVFHHLVDGAAGADLTGQHDEHRALAEARAAGDPAAAARLLARHLARGALTLIAELAPHHEPIAIRASLRLLRDSGGAPRPRAAPAGG